MMSEKKDVRIQMVMSPAELEALDAWRAARRIWSRSEAIRQLVAQGVARAATEDSTGDQKPA